jgi:hypothetical protein
MEQELLFSVMKFLGKRIVYDNEINMSQALKININKIS